MLKKHCLYEAEGSVGEPWGQAFASRRSAVQPALPRALPRLEWGVRREERAQSPWPGLSGCRTLHSLRHQYLVQGTGQWGRPSSCSGILHFRGEM